MSTAVTTAKKPGYSEILDRPDQEAVRHDLEVFFGPHSHVFLAIYDKMRGASGRRRLQVRTWSWPAFFIGFVWYAYRKMYLMAATFVLLPIILVKIIGGTAGGTGTAVFSAMYAKSWYVTNALRRVQKADALGLAGVERDDYLRRAGGVSLLAGVISGLIFAASVTLAIYGIYLGLHRS